MERAAPYEQLFELELYGEGIEKRYRRLRPEVEAMPWGTLDTQAYPEHVVVAARRTWTEAAFQEHRTGALPGRGRASRPAALIGSSRRVRGAD